MDEIDEINNTLWQIILNKQYDCLRRRGTLLCEIATHKQKIYSLDSKQLICLIDEIISYKIIDSIKLYKKLEQYRNDIQYKEQISKVGTDTLSQSDNNLEREKIHSQQISKKIMFIFVTSENLYKLLEKVEDYPARNSLKISGKKTRDFICQPLIFFVNNFELSTLTEMTAADLPTIKKIMFLRQMSKQQYNDYWKRIFMIPIIYIKKKRGN